jgi:hypothetical protein
MKNRLWLTLVGGIVLAMLTSMGTTGALWHDATTVDAGTVTTGSLVLLVGGQPAPYTFNALSAGNLTPGQAVRAPLTISNGGSTDMTYSLPSVAAAAVSLADQELSAAMLLTVTVNGVCGETPPPGPVLLDHVPLDPAATFAGRPLAPSSSETLCIEVALDANAPIAAATGATSVTFTFRGDQT